MVPMLWLVPEVAKAYFLVRSPFEIFRSLSGEVIAESVGPGSVPGIGGLYPLILPCIPSYSGSLKSFRI